jgi:hypothetical protein
MNRIVFDDFDFPAGLRVVGGEADQLRFLAAPERTRLNSKL